MPLEHKSSQSTSPKSCWSIIYIATILICNRSFFWQSPSLNMKPQQWFRKRSADGQTAPMYNSTHSQLPMLHLPDTVRNNFIAVVGEFVGTFLFLFFSFAGTQVSNTPKPAEGAAPNTQNLLYSALCFGFSLMVNVWAFYRVTGGLFNPSVCRVIPMCEYD